MPAAKIELTEREKTALQIAVSAELQDWKQIYIIAFPERYATVKNQSVVTRWKKSKLVIDYFDICKYQRQKRKEEERNKIIQEYEQQQREAQDCGDLERNSEMEGGKKSEGLNFFPSGSGLKTDFTDRSQFLQYLNKAANDPTLEDKDKRELLKMISDNLRFKEPERHENKEIQRFYLPITCNTCPLYNNRSK